MAEVVVITGASAGVGRATARAFAAAGADVALLARGTDRLERARDEVVSMNRRALVVPTDVSDTEQVERAATRVEESLGPIDVWVNDAMATVFAPLPKVEPEEFRRVTEVTYLGTVNGTMAALRRMLPRDSGTIVQVGSALAYRGIPLQSAYCGAKHAIKGFTESLRCELLHDGSGVRVTMVHLPAVNTPQFEWSRSRMPRRARPVPPIYQPEIAADAIVWAAHHNRREVLVGGTTVATILAEKLFPGLLDRYLGWQGESSQMVDEPERPGRPDDLFEPVPGDFEARGRFDSVSHGRSVQTWVTTHRPALAAGALAAISLLGWSRTSR
jgi:NAD(P)-dependent dehydrogenase (short-subunit alcohol dehydrogenase family)